MDYREELKAQRLKNERNKFIGKMVMYAVGIALIFGAMNMLGKKSADNGQEAIGQTKIQGVTTPVTGDSLK
ncbi:MAG: hypothetical protein B6226_02185 [Candidatus Cloacimonetes bacterium 4572_65]|nr:MAG: hypothetical protein B6226_02185 [Candidatus Cloacimonetes bacterium 4572_65]